MNPLLNIKSSTKTSRLFAWFRSWCGNRHFHRWYARREGYFFLPCPVCGEWFGGHEIAHLETRTLFTRAVGPLSYGMLVCPREECRDVAAKSWESQR